MAKMTDIKDQPLKASQININVFISSASFLSGLQGVGQVFSE